jgi:hypothetical protein
VTNVININAGRYDMKYTLQKNNVIFITAGRKDLKINVVKGKIWITKKAVDIILADGDTISLTNCGKVGIQAFHDSDFLLEGNKFNLYELIREEKKIRINKVHIGQKKKPNRSGTFDAILRVPSWKETPVTVF